MGKPWWGDQGRKSEREQAKTRAVHSAYCDNIYRCFGRSQKNFQLGPRAVSAPRCFTVIRDGHFGTTET